MLSILATEAGEAVQQDNPILPTVPEMFWGAVSFFALFLLIKFVLLPPVKKVMDDRAQQIRGDLDAAEKARERADSAAEEAHDELADVRAEAAQIVDQARTEAETERARIIGDAETEVAAMKAEAEAEIANARAEALSGVGPQVSDLAVDAASRVMGRQVSLAQSQPIVDRYLSNLN